MAAFLALDRGEVRIDPAGTDLRIGEGQRDVFASRRLRLAHPAATDFGGSVSGEDTVVRLALSGFLAILLDADGRVRFIMASVPSKPALVSLTYPSAFAIGVLLFVPLALSPGTLVPVDAGP